MYARLHSPIAFLEFDRTIAPLRQVLEPPIASQENVEIDCSVCLRKTRAKVNAGALFGNDPNLREGLICEGCGMSNRNRLMTTLVRRETDRSLQRKVAVFENESALTTTLKSDGYEVTNSIFDPDCSTSLHQDITSTTYRDAQFDLVVHNDVLEHVPDYRAALADNFRILRPGGYLIFTTPLVAIERTIIRARMQGSEIEHILEPEIHGDPLNAEGVLAFYNFGADLIESVAAAGFEGASVVVSYDPAGGFTSNYHPSPNTPDGSSFGNMLPCAILAQRPGDK